MAVQLRVILQEHSIKKLTLPTGIPNTVDNLVSIITKTFQLHGEYGLLYQDKDFDNQFFSVTSTADLYDKATVKMILKEPNITLDLHPIFESGPSSTLSSLSSVSTHPASTPETNICPEDHDASSQVSDSTSSDSSDTIILPDSCRLAAWPVPFQVPEFSRDIQLILAEANNSYHATGRHFMDASVKSAIMQEMFKERWPALFIEAQIKEEFRRITTVSLEETFMLKLDEYTPGLMQLMRAKGGAAGSKMHPLLDTLNDTQSIEEKRDAVVCCLINYLGERQEDLFHDCQECEDYTDKTMKVIVMHNIMAEEDPSDVSIVIEGNQVMEGCGRRTKACVLLMGLIYALNLDYPKQLKNTFEAFQKLFLELDGEKLLKKDHSLKNKLLQ
ncbi:uncharacterized protein LOC122820502 [Gambusia affinis]|uniref:uncharacterized protein LOC122820502 n=1 Tax=Gambusia affinis TaxID=33528 RepID=UPI001CDB586A|nr:uncharacterized protein LOC122820502 [Gambusia affinis]